MVLIFYNILIFKDKYNLFTSFVFICVENYIRYNIVLKQGNSEEKFEIVRTMLAKGLDIQLIMEIAQLLKEEIEQLKS